MLRLMARKAKDIPHKLVLWPRDFAKILVDTILTAREKQQVPGPLWQNTILIQADRVHTLHFCLSRVDKEYLFQFPQRCAGGRRGPGPFSWPSRPPAVYADKTGLDVIDAEAMQARAHGRSRRSGNVVARSRMAGWSQTVEAREQYLAWRPTAPSDGAPSVSIWGCSTTPA